MSSDFIVGFPGETERRFRRDHETVDEVGFDDSLLLLYSPRPGTPAAELADDTPHAVKQARLRATAGADRGAGGRDQPGHGRQRPARAGRGRRRKDAGELCGRSGNNRMVNFAGPPELVGRMVDVHITAALIAYPARRMLRSTADDEVASRRSGGVACAGGGCGQLAR